jgi:hypothetical protein
MLDGIQFTIRRSEKTPADVLALHHTSVGRLTTPPTFAATIELHKASSIVTKDRGREQIPGLIISPASASL